MASTPRGSWPGCASFGFRDYFEEDTTRPELPAAAIEAANQAFAELGIDGLRVESIVKDDSANQGTHTYAVTLTMRDARRTVRLAE
jgi:hypothetical protein